MRIDLYIHAGADDPIVVALHKLEHMMSELTDKVDVLTQKVTAETTVEQAAITLMQGLSAAIADLKNQLQSSGDVAAAVAKLTELGSTIDARKQALADAIVANTPAA